MTASSAGPRRTQAERRAAAISALVDATVSSLCERGYAGTTTAEISRRAGMSQGGLFRHFETRLELVVAAADEVRARQLAAFRSALGRLGEATVEDCVLLLRAACRAPMNAAWYALLVAARTDPDLRRALGPMVERYHREILDLGRSLPVAGTIPEPELDTLLLGIVHLLDGEALVAAVHAHPEQEDRRVAQLVRVLSGQPAWDPA